MAKDNPLYIFFLLFTSYILLWTLWTLWTETYNLLKRLQNDLSDNETVHITVHNSDQLWPSNYDPSFHTPIHSKNSHPNFGRKYLEIQRPDSYSLFSPT